MALNDSQMAMWKTIVALVHVDGVLHPEEKDFLENRFEKLSVSPQQKKDLMDQLESPEETRVLFDQITEPAHRSQLIYFARLLFHSDKDFSAIEKKILDQLNSQVMSQVDMTETMRKMDRVVVEFQNQQQANRDRQPLHRRIINTIVFWEDLDNLD